MNGALIANEDRDSDGNFTDHGHLTLKVGELFVQHIYDYDKGVTLGAAVGLNNAKDPRNSGQSYVDFMPTFGAFNKDGITRSTIGHGDAQVGSCDLDDAYGCGASTLNLDVEKVQEFNTNYSIEPI